jgi:hypothetical protein
MTITVTQNGKNVKLPTLKGKINFAPGYRKDREVSNLSNLRPGTLVIRERNADRTLVKVTEVNAESGFFTGSYVTPQGKPVKECSRSEFNLNRPIFRARPSR